MILRYFIYYFLIISQFISSNQWTLLFSDNNPPVIQIYTPLNNSNFYNTLFYKFEIIPNNYSNYNDQSYYLSITTPYIIILANKTVDKRCYDLALGSSLFQSGLNIITTSIYDSYTNKLIASSILHVTQIIDTNDYFNSILTLSKSTEYTEHYTYLIIGLGDYLYTTEGYEMMSRFIELESDRLIVITQQRNAHDWADNIYNTGNTTSTKNESEISPNFCITHFGSVKTCHHTVDTLAAMSYIVYVDAAFIIIDHSFLSSLLDISYKNTSYTHTQYNYMLFWKYIISITRRNVWLLLPLNSTLHYPTLKKIMREVGFEPVTFQRESTESIKVSEVYPGYEIWTILLTTSTTTPATTMPINSATTTATVASESSETIVKDVNINGHENTDDLSSNIQSENTVETKSSTILMDNYDVSRSFILLSHACIATQDPKLIILRKNITQYKYNISIVNMTLLAEQEDFGFLYTGYRFLELNPQDYDRNEVQAMIYNEILSWPVVPGVTGLSGSVSPGHIVHESEPLMQLLYASNTLLKLTGINANNDSNSNNVYNNDKIKSTTDEAWLQLLHLTRGSYQDLYTNITLERKYQYISLTMRRLILITLDHTNTNDWLHSFIGVILHIHRSTLRRVCTHFTSTSHSCSNSGRSASGSEVTSSILALCTDFSLGPRVYHRSHLSTLSREYDTNSAVREGICFDQLLILGRSNTHVSYTGSPALSSMLRQQVYDYINLIHGHNTIPTLPPIDSIPPSLRLLRAQKVRVTIVLRGSPSRAMLNLPQLLHILYNTHFIDIQWLREHISTFELLSFKQQVIIMSQTDIFISVHGAAIINSIFMRTGSVMINILNGPFIEYVFTPPLREAGVKLMHIPVLNSTIQCPNTENPPFHSSDTSTGNDTGTGGGSGTLQGLNPKNNSVPLHCLGRDIIDGGDITCVSLRRYSVIVDLQLFRASVYEAYYHILSAKWAPLFL